MIIGSIAAILVTFWFYNTAQHSDRNAVHWAIAGFIIYFIVALLWTYFVNPGIKDAAMHNRSNILKFISSYAYIVVSSACALLFNFKFGRIKQDDEQ